jgi:hypothetical protein
MNCERMGLNGKKELKKFGKQKEGKENGRKLTAVYELIFL